MNAAKDISSVFLHVQGEGKIEEIPVSETFWTDLANGAFPQLDNGMLMSGFTFAESWSTWERHPAGTELVMLISGSATLVIDQGGIEQAIQMSVPGTYVLIPPNTWHTAKTQVPTSMLFLTPGLGTEHRPVAG